MPGLVRTVLDSTRGQFVADTLCSIAHQAGAANPNNEQLMRVLGDAATWLSDALGSSLALLDTETGEVLSREHDQPLHTWALHDQLARVVYERCTCEVLAEEEPLLLLAVPVPNQFGRPIVALGFFITSLAESYSQFSTAAKALGLDPDEALRWSADQSPWNVNILTKMGQLVVDRLQADLRATRAEHEVRHISSNLLASYEEISLLHRLTQNLKITSSNQELCQLALDWLSEVVPFEGLAVKLKPVADQTECHETLTEPLVLRHGDVPLPDDQFDSLIVQLGRAALDEPVVLNRLDQQESWPYESVRSVISVPLAEGNNIFGWLVGFNHRDDQEFGSVEASLLNSVGTILGIHSGNTDLYRQQADFLAGVVRALTSAIDAKDPYTCGHSDRVARVSVRLARELGCDGHILNTIYLSGLLHDIGKIGINDAVLAKPGKLTDAEFEHIKLHPELGYKILRDLKQLDQVLPVVLHHHEAINGTGYPHGLSGSEIPFLARIVAVADSFDAMSSDRPYRKGMEIERIEAILREGAGKQWDAQVVDTYFAVKADIAEIVSNERDSFQFNQEQWI